MNEQKWVEQISKFLVGKTIKTVRYLTAEEADDWYERPIAIVFDDGSFIVPMADDEGNNGGAMYTSEESLPVIPVMQ